MKVLDVFRGRGGWSKPFIEDGDEVWGIDIKDYVHDGRTLVGDIREFDGYGFHDMDLIIGSPPCTEFSIAKHMFTAGNKRGAKPDPEKGLELVRDFYRFIGEARPKFWAMENVTNMERWWKEKPLWRFMISIGGRRSLWGNLPLELSPEFRFRRCFGVTKETRARHKTELTHTADARAEIPYPIARFVADSVKAKVITYKPEVAGGK